MPSFLVARYVAWAYLSGHCLVIFCIVGGSIILGGIAAVTMGHRVGTMEAVTAVLVSLLIGSGLIAVAIIAARTVRRGFLFSAACVMGGPGLVFGLLFGFYGLLISLPLLFAAAALTQSGYRLSRLWHLRPRNKVAAALDRLRSQVLTDGSTVSASDTVRFWSGAFWTARLYANAAVFVSKRHFLAPEMILIARKAEVEISQYNEVLLRAGATRTTTAQVVAAGAVLQTRIGGGDLRRLVKWQGSEPPSP